MYQNLLWRKKNAEKKPDRSFASAIFEEFALLLSLSSHEYVSIMFSISFLEKKKKTEEIFHDSSHFESLQ